MSDQEIVIGAIIRLGDLLNTIRQDLIWATYEDNVQDESSR